MIHSSSLPTAHGEHDPSTSWQLVLRPNCSASWAANKRIFYALTLLSMLIASGFAWVGAWVIIPFAGLELAALGTALYMACWRQHYQQVIRFDEDAVCIEQGFDTPSQSWHLQRSSLRLSVEGAEHHWDAHRLWLQGRDRQGTSHRIALGEFLNKTDSEKLLASLRQQQVTVCNHSANTVATF